MNQEIREYSLPGLLASKHYPQVLRVSRPYFANGQEFLKKGQFITVLDRRKVELIVGLDYDRRTFRIRKDRSAHVEIIEDERIVHSLANVAEIEKHVNAIEFRKEIRLEKQTFGVGEKFTIEKVGKNFRGRCKNVALRRKRDGKIYRFPLDIIGMFKLITGKSMLPVSRVLTLRPTPVTTRFPNTPTTTNLPTGTATLVDSILCDVVYILTVTNNMYQYEVLTMDPNIYVEKCNLVIPKPILEIIPNGTYVTSAEYIQSIKGRYKQMLSAIDSKLVEDIYSPIYYGSASFDKTTDDDIHLITKIRQLSCSKSHDGVMSREEDQLPSTCQFQSHNEHEPPAPYPRYSKKTSYRNNTIHFPVIDEHQRLEKGFIHDLTVQSHKPQQNVKHTVDSGTSMHDTVGRNFVNQIEGDKKFVFSPTDFCRPSQLSLSSKNSSVRSSSSDYYEGQGIVENAASLFYNPHHGPPVMRRHSRSSSNATEDSVDSGVVLTHTNVNSAASSTLSSPTEEKHPAVIYAKPIKNQTTNNVRKITMPPIGAYVGAQQQPANTQAPPLPPRDSIYQNIHQIQVEIDINETSASDYDDIRNLETHDPPYEELPYENMDKFDFRSHSINEPIKRTAGKVIAAQLYKHFVDESPPLDETPPSHQVQGFSPASCSRSQEIQQLSQQEVGDLLAHLNLSTFVHRFNKELINGQLLQELDEETLIKDLKMTQFQARKLHKYIHGWRPLQPRDCNDNEIATVRAKPIFWSVPTVYNELKKINLNSLAFFCRDHQIDGSLLKSLVETNVICSIPDEHGVMISGIEMSRLKAFMLKEWRPDKNFNSTPKTFQTDGESSVSERKEKKYKPLWNRLISQATSTYN